MYALIMKNQQLIGIFTSKKAMKVAIEALIKDDYERTGYHGHYHFRYRKIESNTIDIGLVSCFTMHPEKFEHQVETDWNTGKILKL